MNKTKNTTTGKALCVIILIAAFAVGYNRLVGFAGSVFGGSQEYSYGDAVIEQPVNNLYIDWTSGTVDIEYHSSNTVEIHETAKKTIRKEEQMVWQLDGDTLRIEYEEPGIHLFRIEDPKKELTVTLPESIILKDTTIDATSGALNIPSLQTDSLVLDVTSGDIFASAEARVIETDLTSGSVILKAGGNPEAIHVSSTSGNIHVEFEQAGKVKASSTSGDIFVQAGAFQTMDLDATSGNVTASLRPEPGFTARFDTSSGSVDYKLPLFKQDKSYVCGDGSAKLKIDTTSGNITIGSYDENE